MALRARHRGFTMIEVATVLGIIAVLSTISILGLSSLRKRGSWASATGDVVLALRQAKSEAYGRGSVTVVVFDTAGGHLWVLEDINGDFDLSTFDPANPTSNGDRLIAQKDLPTGVVYGPANGQGAALAAPFASVPSFSGSSPAPNLGYCSFCDASGAKAGFGFVKFTPGRPVTFSSNAPTGTVGQQVTLASAAGTGVETMTIAILTRTGTVATFPRFQ